MVRPRLIHPVSVMYRVLERASGNFDDNDRTPTRVAKRKTATELNAQVKWITDGELVPTPGGPTVRVLGYILCETQELETKSIEPKFGDQITEISGQSQIELFVLSTKPRGHYSDIGGPGLLQVDFYRKQKAA